MEASSPCKMCYIHGGHGYTSLCDEACDYAVKCEENAKLKNRIEELESIIAGWRSGSSAPS